MNKPGTTVPIGCKINSKKPCASCGERGRIVGGNANDRKNYLYKASETELFCLNCARKFHIV